MTAQAEIGVLGPNIDLPTRETLYERAVANKAHTFFLLSTTYRETTGIVQMPVAGPYGTPSQILDWGGGCWKKIVVWEAVCEGGKPSLPSAAPANPNERLESRDFTPQAPALMSDGITKVYRCTGVYIYALYSPPDFAAGVPMGRLPWDGSPVEVIRQADFDTHAAGGASGAAAAAGAAVGAAGAAVRG